MKNSIDSESLAIELHRCWYAVFRRANIGIGPNLRTDLYRNGNVVGLRYQGREYMFLYRKLDEGKFALDVHNIGLSEQYVSNIKHCLEDKLKQTNKDSREYKNYSAILLNPPIVSYQNKNYFGKEYFGPLVSIDIKIPLGEKERISSHLFDLIRDFVIAPIHKIRGDIHSRNHKQF